MNMIKLIFVGKTKEKFINLGISEFAKRLERFGKFKIIEIKDSNVEDEGKKIIEILKDDYAVVLAVEGREFSSEEFADFFRKNADKNIFLVIGSANGLSENVLNRANLKLSLSRMTLTHEMARLFLIEQIYRAFTIILGRRYHK